MAEVEIVEMQRWVGKTETRTDQITAAPLAALCATLDIDAPTPREGDSLPPLWHWLYFWAPHRQSELAEDGHLALGQFLPPVSLPRRMWAGGRFEFHRSLRVGEILTRTARIVRVEQKKGRHGPLVFVVVRYETEGSEGMAMTEEQDIVYRENARPGDSQPGAQSAPVPCAWERTMHASEVLLFRYSALTFNAHRIHYDRRFATEGEGYPGLVVHGPLIATLLLDLLRRNMPEANVKSFVFRAFSALYDTSPFAICGQPESDGETVSLWARDANGGAATVASAVITA
jgi:3-methylfumaryl-CoA hydratase